MPTRVISQASTQVTGCLSRIVGRSESSMKGALKGDVALCKLGHPLTLRKETYLHALVIHGREISIELVGPPKAQEESP